MRRRVFLAIALVALVTLSPIAATAATANTALNYTEGPNPFVEEDTLTVAEHDRGEMSVLQYYDDGGEVTDLPAELNTSLDEQVSVRYDRVDASVLSDFPRDKDNVSALDASEWSTDASIGASDTTPTEGIDAVEISTDGSMTDGDSMTASFSNFSISTDAEKRVPIVIGNVDDLGSGATVEINFTSTDGDAATVTIDSGATASDDDVMATETGDGFVWQQRLSEMAIAGGDGTLEDIESVDVTVHDAEATVTLTGLGAEKKSTYSLGDHYFDGDGDGDAELHEGVEVINGANQSGYVGLTDLSTMDAAFDDATIQQLQVHGVQYTAEYVDAADVNVDFTDDDPDYPSWAGTAEVYYRLNVPTAIDLSHSGLTLNAEQKFSDNRYATVEYAEGDSSDFGNVSSWSDLSSTYSDKGETHELDATVSAGTDYVFHTVLTLSADELDALQATGGAGGPVGSSGGWMSIIMNPLSWLVGGLVGVGSRLARLTRFPWVV